MDPPRSENRFANHAIPVDHFDQLASGGGDRRTIELLLRGEYSRRLLLLRALLDLVARRPDSLGPLPPVTSVWRSLDALEKTAGTGSQAMRTVLLHPQVGTWLARSLRLLRGTASSEMPLWAEIGHVHSVVFAIAVRTGAMLHTRIPVYAGHALVPTLGLARFPDEQRTATAEAITHHNRSMLRTGRATVALPEDPADDAPGWWGLRKVTADTDGVRLEVWLDDVDRYRDLAEPVEPARLDRDGYVGWRRTIREAWRIIGEVDPEAVPAMSEGLLSIVPIAEDENRRQRSASTGDAFGSALVSPTTDHLAFAVSLVHEFQHIKLGGLLHLLSIHNDHGAESLYAPWRDDPRPLSGLFQGIYAFLGIARFWSRYVDACQQHERGLSEFELAYARRQTWLGLRTAVRSGMLTDLGKAFVAGMDTALRPVLSKPISADARRAATAATLDHRATWRIRNLQEEPSRAEVLADAFIRTSLPPRLTEGEPILTPDKTRWLVYPRIELLRLWCGQPDRFAALLDASEHGPDWQTGATAQDLLLAAGDYRGAAHGFENRLVADPGDYDAWSGLVLATVFMRAAGWRTLFCRPERVRDVFLAARRQSSAATPSSVAAWLDSVGAESCS